MRRVSRDSWTWNGDPSGLYSTKSTYTNLSTMHGNRHLNAELADGFKLVMEQIYSGEGQCTCLESVMGQINYEAQPTEEEYHRPKW